ncbi:unnamed protein product [Protopolystoma xenopodis]|uniref:Uncharacterized protein n=1 Tax=Protopolystoma xenopodis TaxID=117903 RepID=A0A3S5AKI8_9PLAT|nr:unnamed protein product [Protopolystoma xenopodis]
MNPPGQGVCTSDLVKASTWVAWRAKIVSPITERRGPAKLLPVAMGTDTRPKPGWYTRHSRAGRSTKQVSEPACP